MTEDLAAKCRSCGAFVDELTSPGRLPCGHWASGLCRDCSRLHCDGDRLGCLNAPAMLPVRGFAVPPPRAIAAAEALRAGGGLPRVRRIGK